MTAQVLADIALDDEDTAEDSGLDEETAEDSSLNDGREGPVCMSVPYCTKAIAGA
jgi:arginine deiminase